MEALGAGFTTRAAGTGDALAGDEPHNIVNRLSDRGLQLEQSLRVRQDPGARDALVDALARQLAEETGH